MLGINTLVIEEWVLVYRRTYSFIMLHRHQGLFLAVLFLNIVQFSKWEYIQYMQNIEYYLIK